MLCLEHYLMWPRSRETEKIGKELFAELENVVLEESGKDKLVKGIN